MKVCYVTHLPNLTGASQSLLDILTEVQKGDYDIEPVVLLGKHGPLEEELRALHVPCKVLRYTSEISDPNPFKNFFKRCWNRFAVRNIADWFQAEKFDLIHNNSLLTRTGMEAAKRARIPYISHNREFVWEDHNIKLLNEKASYRLMEQAEQCICISDAVYQKFSKLVPNAHYTLLRDGLNIEQYRCPHDKLFSGSSIEVLLAGRLSPGKGQMDALEAFHILEDRGENRFHLTIVGGEAVQDRAYAEELRQFADRYHLSNVTFLPFVDNLKELRSRTDIALVCSKMEALGRVTIESMLAGCLTIGANAGATPEIITDGGNGLLYPSGNANVLAEILVSAAENPEKSRQIAQQGITTSAERFDLPTYVTTLETLYRRIVR